MREMIIGKRGLRGPANVDAVTRRGDVLSRERRTSAAAFGLHVVMTAPDYSTA